MAAQSWRTLDERVGGRLELLEGETPESLLCRLLYWQAGSSEYMFQSFGIKELIYFHSCFSALCSSDPQRNRRPADWPDESSVFVF